MEVLSNYILKVVRHFYGFPETDNHWFAIYYKYLINNLFIT